MSYTLEELKRVDLVQALTVAWNMKFKGQANGSFVAGSPFRPETRASFYVSCLHDGHWVYCDHSDGSSGSIIDLMMRRKGTGDFKVAKQAALDLVLGCGLQPAPPLPESAPGDAGSGIDLNWLQQQLQRRSSKPAVDYLTGRCIDKDLVHRLADEGILMLNQWDGSDYCCLATRDRNDTLRSLYNRKIDGDAERTHFLLGWQHPFCLDWGALKHASCVYICGAIIDGLSLLSLHPHAVVLAVPGANYDFSRLELPPSAHIIEAFDADEAGRSAASRLQKLRPDGSLSNYDLEGCSDVNELLCRRRSSLKLSLEDRIAIALSDAPSRELAEQYKVHHSRICDVRKEALLILAEEWESRRPGRKPKPKPSEETVQRDREQEALQRQYELSLMRNDWLNLQLELMAEHAAAAGQADFFNQLKKKADNSRPASQP